MQRSMRLDAESCHSEPSKWHKIPPHDGHPCLWLTLPAVGCIWDFHPIERPLVGRSIKPNRVSVIVLSTDTLLG